MSYTAPPQGAKIVGLPQSPMNFAAPPQSPEVVTAPLQGPTNFAAPTWISMLLHCWAHSKHDFLQITPISSIHPRCSYPWILSRKFPAFLRVNWARTFSDIYLYIVFPSPDERELGFDSTARPQWRPSIVYWQVRGLLSTLPEIGREIQAPPIPTSSWYTAIIYHKDWKFNQRMFSTRVLDDSLLKAICDSLTSSFRTIDV